MARDPMRMQSVHPAATPRAPGVRPALVFVARVETDGPYDWGAHRHGDYEAIAIERGAYRCLLDGVEVAVAPGEVLLVAPGELHQDLLPAGMRYGGISFRVEGLRRSVPVLARGAPPASRTARLGVSAVRSAIDGLIEAAAARDGAGGRLLDARLSAFFWEVLRRLPRAALAPAFRGDAASEELLDRLMRLFETRLANPPSVAEMARACGVSATTLGERCRVLLGAGPAAAFRAHRLERARALLEHAHLPVGEAARRLGFADQFHFSRLFKRQFGYPPSRASSRTPTAER
jgi:AraC-like DNA-binding protein